MGLRPASLRVLVRSWLHEYIAILDGLVALPVTKSAVVFVVVGLCLVFTSPLNSRLFILTLALRCLERVSYWKARRTKIQLNKDY